MKTHASQDAAGVIMNYSQLPATHGRPLGQSPLIVSPVGLGCWQFAGGGVHSGTWRSPSQDIINQIVAVSLAGGVNWFDTAEIYGFGRSERAVATALVAANQADGGVVIATKWSPFLRTASSIWKTFPVREKFLSPFHIDLLQVHLPYSFSPVGAQMNALADLLDTGKIKAAGVSNFSASWMRQAHNALKLRGYPLASNQVRYNLLDREIEQNGVLETALELGVTIIAYSPLAKGLLSGRYHDNPTSVEKPPLFRRRAIRRGIEKARDLVKLLVDIAASYNVSPSQVA